MMSIIRARLDSLVKTIWETWRQLSFQFMAPTDWRARDQERKAEIAARKAERQLIEQMKREAQKQEDSEFWLEQRESEAPEDRTHDRLSLNRDQFRLPNRPQRKDH